MSLRERLLDKGRLAVEPVEIASFGETVYARQISAGDLFRIVGNGEDALFQNARLLIASIRDAAGEPVFASDDVGAIQDALTPIEFNALVKAANKVSGLVEGDAEKK